MAEETKFVAYRRVSTADQGDSGLGLSAQETAVHRFVTDRRGRLVGDFKEVVSGGAAAKPELERALTQCRRTGARLLVAKLDRLSRDLDFLRFLMKSGVPFTCVDMPEMNETAVTLVGLIAEFERKAIQARTRAALGEIKAKLARGEVHVSKKSGRVVTRLGRSAPPPVSGYAQGGAAMARKADAWAADICREIVALKGEVGTLQAVADACTAKEWLTPAGGTTWTPTTVRRVLARCEHHVATNTCP